MEFHALTEKDESVDGEDYDKGDDVKSGDGNNVDDSNGDKVDAGKAEDAESSKENPSSSLKQDDKILFVGQRISSIAELEAARYEGRNFCELWKRDVRTLVAALKQAPKRVADANLSLNYYFVKLCCKFGGRSVKQREDRQHDTKSFKQGCPFEVCLSLSSDGAMLDVLKINQSHNHPLSEDIY
jgi:hypothetical protein